jgi:histidinol phosphatase-like PHP family hydrolase
MDSRSLTPHLPTIVAAKPTEPRPVEIPGSATFAGSAAAERSSTAQTAIGRRRFIGWAGAAVSAAMIGRSVSADESPLSGGQQSGRESSQEPSAARRRKASERFSDRPQDEWSLPLTDYHVHRDNTTLDRLLEISARRGVRFGIVEHAGTKENRYPIVLSNDDELQAYIASLDGKPVLKGVQAEWLDWPTCFSKALVAKLDYVLGDAMTIRGDGGKRVKMWEPGFLVRGKERFMDEYTEFNVEVLATEPLDIFANPTYLPPSLEKEYDSLWTEKRMQKVVDAAVKHHVAIEINSQLRLPRERFLRMAKAAGAKFSFGSNIRGPEVGRLDYCVAMAKRLGLGAADLFQPAPAGQKPIQKR